MFSKQVAQKNLTNSNNVGLNVGCYKGFQHVRRGLMRTMSECVMSIFDCRFDELYTLETSNPLFGCKKRIFVSLFQHSQHKKWIESKSECPYCVKRINRHLNGRANVAPKTPFCRSTLLSAITLPSMIPSSYGRIKNQHWYTCKHSEDTTPHHTTPSCSNYMHMNWRMAGHSMHTNLIFHLQSLCTEN